MTTLPVAPPGPVGRRIERHDTIVVGAGQAGLAVGQQLVARDVDVTLVDAADRIGASWRARWDSLRLFTPAAYSGLPGMPFPARGAHLPDKDEVAEYLERYAARFELPVRLGTRIDRLRHDGGRYVMESDDVRLEADNVVVATGPFQRPHIPAVAARLSPAIHQLHTSQYVNPHLLPEGPVLVVGAGNSGAQIALELARSREVTLAGQTTGHLPRRALGRDLYDWVWPVLSRATLDTPLGRRIEVRARRGDPLIGIRARELVRQGLRRVDRLGDVRDGHPVCGGDVIDAGVVIWATGFRPDFDWIDVPVFTAQGMPRHRRGVVTESPGLFFLGLRFQHTMTSALLGGVGRDAAFIADHVAARSTMAAAE